MTKCKYSSCEEDAIAYFELISLNGERWVSPYCLKHILIMQGQGYRVEIKEVMRTSLKKVKEEIKSGRNDNE